MVNHIPLRSQAGVDIVFVLCRKTQHCSINNDKYNDGYDKYNLQYVVLR